MDAPTWELLVRALYAVVATLAFASLALGWRYLRSYSAAALTRYLTVVIGVNAAWRWYVLWLGLQHDADGQWSVNVEPMVRTLGNALLILLFVAVGLLAYFHTHRRGGS